MNILKRKKAYTFLNKYNEEIFESLNNNRENLINAFTAYYGKEYRNLIEQKINNINFFTFISNGIIDMIEVRFEKLNEFEKEEYKDFQNLIKYFGNKKNLALFFDDNCILPNALKKHINNYIKETNDSCAFQLSNIDINDEPIYNVFLGIGVDDHTIIHEINHVITDSILGKKESEDGQIEMIEKIGITTSEDINDGEALEELLNDKSAHDITTIFHNSNCQISNYHLFTIDAYPTLFPLIDKFYYAYTDIIKKTRITDNHNLILQQVDNDKFQEYQKLIQNELNLLDKDYILSDETIQKANKLISSFKLENKNENMDSYIEELKKQKRIIKTFKEDYLESNKDEIIKSYK